MCFGLAIVFCLAGLTLAAPAWAPPGLVAAYGLTTAPGRRRSTRLATGRRGGRRRDVVRRPLRRRAPFDGTNDYVGLPALGTFYNTAFTLEAWVQKASTKNDVASSAHGRATARCSGSTTWRRVTMSRWRNSSLLSRFRSNPATGQWQHLAATFNGTTARFYVDGAEVASRTVSQAVGTSNTWRIGAYGSVPAASSTASSTRSASTTAHSARPRSRPT